MFLWRLRNKFKRKKRAPVPKNEATSLLEQPRPESSPLEGSSASTTDPRKLYSSGSSLRDSLHKLSQQLSGLVEQHTGSIGYLGSMSIAINSLTGPAMLNLPATFEKSGIIPTSVTLIFVCFLSSFCSLHMCNVISKMPGNRTFQKEIEYSDAFEAYWGKAWFIITQLLFFGCINCLNISSIVDTFQVIDSVLGDWLITGAIKIQGDTVTLITWDSDVCSDEQKALGECVPFEEDGDGLLLTVGKFVTTALFLPLALMDLTENAAWQIFAFLILLVTSVQFIVEFLHTGFDRGDISLWGHDWEDMFGVILFNFALVIAIPAWLYEREPHVDVPTVIHGSSIFSTILYIVIGILGCLAMPNVSDNMLQSLMSGSHGVAIQIGASVFAIGIVGLGIPLFSVLTRLNLTGSNLCSHEVGNLLAVYLPFGIAWFIYDGTAIEKLLSWGGIVFTSLIAFVLPLLLALYVTSKVDEEGSISVYFGFLRGKKAEKISLVILFLLAITSILAAVVGNLIPFG